jgi:hypothetical protein
VLMARSRTQRIKTSLANRYLTSDPQQVCFPT